MAPMKDERIKSEIKTVETKKGVPKKDVNKGAWTIEEDRKLAEAIEVNGAKRWEIIAAKAGLKRCGKSCRLRWLNYLRPNIKRGNISDQEEDLILRLHKLLGNRWSLIAGRLPGRTDNEIKNYWNSHLSKKMHKKEKPIIGVCSTSEGSKTEKMMLNEKVNQEVREEPTSNSHGGENSDINFNVDDFFDFSNEDPLDLPWMSQPFELDKSLSRLS